MTEKTRKSLITVNSRPGVMYGLYKAYEANVDDCPLIRPILSALNTPTSKLIKLLVIILKALTIN